VPERIERPGLAPAVEGDVLSKLDRPVSPAAFGIACGSAFVLSLIVGLWAVPALFAIIVDLLVSR
jgi:hypothetical protein